MPRRLLTRFAPACLAALLAAAPAHAVITKLTPLKEVLEDYPHIFVAKVEQVRATPAPPGLVLTLGENLQGKWAFARLPINLKGDDFAAEHKHTEAMLERVEKDLPIVVFVEAPDEKKQYFAIGYSNGTWFSMNGRAEKIDDKE